MCVCVLIVCVDVCARARVGAQVSVDLTFGAPFLVTPALPLKPRLAAPPPSTPPPPSLCSFPAQRASTKCRMCKHEESEHRWPTKQDQQQAALQTIAEEHACTEERCKCTGYLRPTNVQKTSKHQQINCGTPGCNHPPGSHRALTEIEIEVDASNHADAHQHPDAAHPLAMALCRCLSHTAAAAAVAVAASAFIRPL